MFEISNVKYIWNRFSFLVLGEYIADDEEAVDEKGRSTCTKYKLVGVVVHSGQASGGHYYSYILHRWWEITAAP